MWLKGTHTFITAAGQELHTTHAAEGAWAG
jgi:hypothetical protein